VSKSGGGDVKRFHWLRCIVKLHGTDQTRNLKSMEVMVLRFCGMMAIS